MYEFENYYRVKVERVVDGDTLVVSFYLGLGVWLNDQKIRLRGINTPETRGEGKEEGLRVKNYLIKMVDQTQDFIVKTDEEKKGKFGRFLVILYLLRGGKWQNINRLLLDQGAAQEYMASSDSQTLKEVFEPPPEDIESRVTVDEERTEKEIYEKEGDVPMDKVHVARELMGISRLLMGARGRAQEALWDHLMAYPGADWVSINDLARKPAFRGIHYSQIQKAAKALKNQGLIEFEDLHRVKQSSVGDIKEIEPVESAPSKTRKTKRIEDDDE